MSMAAFILAALLVAPSDWRKESFDFPLRFAPSIPYQGTEHVRFNPKWDHFGDDAGFSYVVLWDVDTLDWTGIGQSTLATRALAGTSGSIVLMHTTPTNTTDALPRIVTEYRKRGFTFVTVQQLLDIPGPAPFQ